MSKKQPKLSQTQELSNRLQILMDKRLKAYKAGVSHDIMRQIDLMIEQTRLDLYTETELEIHRRKNDDDGEQWIV